MSNHDAAKKVKNMDEPQRAQLKQNLYGVIFKALAAISLLGAIGAFFIMGGADEDASRYRNDGVVSQALVILKDTENRVRVVHNPSSSITMADIGTKVQVAELPVPVAGETTGTVKMSDEEYANVSVGQVIPVVSTPYEPSSPRTLASLQAPESSGGIVWLAIFAVLGVVLWLVGAKFAKK